MGVLGVACAAVLGCSARTPTPVHGIELEDPQQQANRGAAAGDPSPAAAGAQAPMGSEFVYSREPQQQRHDAPQLPIHINDSWWSFRAQHLSLSEEEAQRRDERLSRARAPEGFWDSQTSVEAVSVWTVRGKGADGEDLTQRCTCRSCHRELEPLAAHWGQLAEAGLTALTDLARFPRVREDCVGSSAAARSRASRA